MSYLFWSFAVIVGILGAGFFLSCALDEKGVEDYGQKFAPFNYLIHYFWMGLLAVFIFGPPSSFIYFFYLQLNFNYLLALPLGIVCGLIAQAAIYLIVIIIIEIVTKISDR